MRKLCLSDAFKVSRMLDTVNAAEETMAIYNETTSLKKEISSKKLSEEDKKKAKENLSKTVGAKIISFLIRASAKKEFEEMLYDFLADLSGIDMDSIKTMSLPETKDLFKQIAKENDLESFFKDALDSE